MWQTNLQYYSKHSSNVEIRFLENTTLTEKREKWNTFYVRFIITLCFYH